MTYRKVHGVGIFTGGTWCVGYLYTRLGWFNCSEPPRTSSNLFMAEKARRVECFHMSSGWFDYTEPSLPTGWNRVCRVVYTRSGWFNLYRSFSNNIFTGGTGCVRYTYTRLVQSQRTTSNLFMEEETGCVEYVQMSSGWSDNTNFL